IGRPALAPAAPSQGHDPRRGQVHAARGQIPEGPGAVPRAGKAARAGEVTTARSLRPPLRCLSFTARNRAGNSQYLVRARQGEPYWAEAPKIGPLGSSGWCRGAATARTTWRAHTNFLEWRHRVVSNASWSQPNETIL